MDRFFERGGAWVLGQILVLLLVFGLPYLLPDDLLPWPMGTATLRDLVGTVIAAAGLVLFVLGALNLGRNLTPMPWPKDHATLVREGIFRWVRHPIYGGIILLGVASALRDPSMVPMVFAIVMAVFFDRKASREEVWLKERYPEYTGYLERTSKLIPFLY